MVEGVICCESRESIRGDSMSQGREKRGGTLPGKGQGRERSETKLSHRKSVVVTPRRTRGEGGQEMRLQRKVAGSQEEGLCNPCYRIGSLVGLKKGNDMV